MCPLWTIFQESFLDSTCEDLFLQIPVVICHVLICCLKLFGGGVVERNELGVLKEAKCRRGCCSTGQVHPLCLPPILIWRNKDSIIICRHFVEEKIMEHATSSSREFNVLSPTCSPLKMFHIGPATKSLSVSLWDTELTWVKALYERGLSHSYCQKWQ